MNGQLVIPSGNLARRRNGDSKHRHLATERDRTGAPVTVLATATPPWTRRQDNRRRNRVARLARRVNR